MSLRSSVLRLGSANMVMLGAQLVTIVLLGLVARASELGLFLLCQSIAQTFAAFAAFRFDSAIPAARSNVERSALLICAVTAMCVISGLTVAAVFGGRAMALFQLQNVPAAGALLVGALTLATALGQLGRYFQIRAQALTLIERATYFRAGAILILRGATMGWLLLIPASAADLPQGMLLLAGELVASAGFAAIVLPRPSRRSLVRARAPRVWRAAIRRNWKFPTLEMPSAMIDSVANNAPIYLVTQFFGLTATAAFGLAFRAMVVPIGQLALALTEVLQSHYAALLHAGRLDAFVGLFRRSSLICAMLGLAASVVAFFTVEPVVVLVAGEKLRLFAQICAIIAPWVAMIVLININSRLVPLLHAQELKLVYDFASGGGMVAVFLAQLHLHLPILSFIALLTAVQVASFAVYWLLLNHAVRRAVRVATRGTVTA